MNLHFVEAATAEFAVIKTGQVVNQNLIHNIRFVCGDAVFALGEIGNSWNHGVRFFPDHDWMTRSSGVSSDALPQIRAVDVHIQAIAIHVINSYELRVNFYPPVVQVRVAAVPVEVRHTPTATAKPCGMLFDDRAVFH